MEFISSIEINPGFRVYTNFWVGWVGQNNFELNFIMHYNVNHFQFIDSTLFAQVR